MWEYQLGWVAAGYAAGVFTMGLTGIANIYTYLGSLVLIGFLPV